MPRITETGGMTGLGGVYDQRPELRTQVLHAQSAQTYRFRRRLDTPTALAVRRRLGQTTPEDFAHGRA